MAGLKTSDSIWHMASYLAVTPVSKNDVTWSYFTTWNLKILTQGAKIMTMSGFKVDSIAVKNKQTVCFLSLKFSCGYLMKLWGSKMLEIFFVCNLAKYFLTIKVLFCVAALHILKLLYQLADSGRVKWEAQIDFSGNNLWSFHASPAVAQCSTFWEPLVLLENKMSACL